MFHRAREHFARAGAFGVWRAVQGKLLRRPVEVEVRPPGLANPVVLRMRSSDLWCYDKVFRECEYDLPLPPDPAVIVDAGANIGLAAVYFAHRFPGARVIALEPEAANFAQLVKNAGPYPMIEPVRAALWCENGTLDLVDPGSGSWGFRTQRPGGHGTPLGRVDAVTVDRLLDERAVATADILKMDVEGAEKEIFDNASPWISRVRAVVAEVHEREVPGSRLSFDQATKDFPYCCRRGENLLVAREKYGNMVRR
jgi:FkbM family methyltransferase